MFNIYPLYVIVRRDFIILASFFLARHKGFDIEESAIKARRSVETLEPLLTTKDYPHEPR